MPQLDGSIYITQIFWLLVSFISFWLVMDRLVVPKIAEKIEERKRKYDDYIRKAEEINQKAMDTLKQYEEKLTVAKSKASEQIAQNERELKEMIAQKEDEINRQIKQKLAESEMLLNEEKNEALKKIENMSKDMAWEILKKFELTSLKRTDLDEIALEGDEHE